MTKFLLFSIFSIVLFFQTGYAGSFFCLKFYSASIEHNNGKHDSLVGIVRLLKENYTEENVSQFRSYLVERKFSKIAYQNLVGNVRKQIAIRSKKIAISLERSDSPYADQDVVIIGDGPHAAIAAVNARVANPNLKILAVSAAVEVGGSFIATGGFYRLNSKETMEESSHNFPRSPFQLLDLAEPGFIMAKAIGDIIALNISSAADMLLQQQVVAIHEYNDHSIIELASGLKIRTKAYINATGLGIKPNFGMTDDASLRILSENEILAQNIRDSSYAPSTEHYSNLSVRVSKLTERSGRSFLDPYVGKRIAVVGAGGAGGTIIEALTGYGPEKIYGQTVDSSLGVKVGPSIGQVDAKGHYVGVKSVDWWGQKNQTARSFRDSSNHRFDTTIGQSQVYDTISRVAEEAVRVEKISGESGFFYRLYTENGKYQDYDFVLFATAYKKDNIPIYKNDVLALNDPRLVWGYLRNGNYTVLAKTTDQKEILRSIQVGPSAGQIVPKDEYKLSPTLTWTSIDVLAERTAAATVQIVKSLGKRD